MAKLYKISGLILGLASMVYATVPATPNISSFTQTNDTTACIVPSTGPAGSPVVTPQWLDKVIIGGTSGSGANLVLFNSTWTNTPIISSISLTTIGTINFDNLKVKGICYTTQSNSAGVTIEYKK